MSMEVVMILMILMVLMVLVLLFMGFTMLTLLSSLSVWILIFQSVVFSILIFMMFLVLIKGSSGSDLNLSNFVVSYYMTEMLVEGVFLLGWVLNILELFNMVLIFKMGGFPFIYYKYLLSYLTTCCNLFNSLFFTMYLTISKVWVLVLLMALPMSTLAVNTILILFFVYLLSKGGKLEVKSLTLDSVLFGNVITPIFCLVYPMTTVILYMLVGSFFQFKVISLGGANLMELTSVSLFFLTCLNGNPVFLFGWLKTIAMLVFGVVDLIGVVVALTVSTILLMKSIYFLVFLEGNFSILKLLFLDFEYILFLMSMLMVFCLVLSWAECLEYLCVW